MAGDGDRPVATGLLQVVAGVWLLLQTLVGDLPGRIRSLAGRSRSRAGPLAATPGASGRSGFDDGSAGGGLGGGGGGSW